MKKIIVYKNTKNPVIFDVGAYHGLVTLEYNSLFENPKIYSFEPFPESFNVLASNTRDLKNIQAFELALSDESGTSSFHYFKSSPTNSLLLTDALAEKTCKKGLFDIEEILEVNAKNIDLIVKELGIKKIDLLKLGV
jgi:FkbM family methyltransferase